MSAAQFPAVVTLIVIVPGDPLAAPGLIPSIDVHQPHPRRPEKVPFPFDGLAGGLVGRDTMRCQ